MRTAVSDNWHQLLKDPSGSRAEDRRKLLGKTMVIDKGLGLNSFSDFIGVAGPYVDMIKLAFGTSVLYDSELLRQKLQLASAMDIVTLPGGTLLEAAIKQDVVGSFLDSVAAYGFTGIEISDGTIELDRVRRTSLIKDCVSRGFVVTTEYGKKAAGSVIDPEELAFTAHCDWEAGADLVTVEARESGINVGLFDEEGRCKEAVLESVLEKVDPVGKLMWEAPLKSQQVDLLHQFGPTVHLGNVAPADALALEAMRRGLRSDTFHFGRNIAVIDYMI
ncbi:phosphosulfolactate synthase [Paenibacillus sp. LHD-117]|uniref:phosphosulfolactate synthase n=1 Tax=Paenibacillus sp. LHD-117 TaxID=3071412 RepID=UPI0027DFAAC1|nr:phosphosulfolactate synthase [Paenibacillus sp. LHD-117]MDQ6421060.1 phosphosulfolactate synthase [Paenibacillus sp. LHD-117]